MRFEELQRIIELIDENEKNIPMTPETIEKLLNKYTRQTYHNPNVDLQV